MFILIITNKSTRLSQKHWHTDLIIVVKVKKKNLSMKDFMYRHLPQKFS